MSDALHNLLYVAVALEGGASIVSLDERDRFCEVSLDTRAFDADAVATKFDELAAGLRALPPTPTHEDLARVLTRSVIRSIDNSTRRMKQQIMTARDAAATPARILSRPDAQVSTVPRAG